MATTYYRPVSNLTIIIVVNYSDTYLKVSPHQMKYNEIKSKMHSICAFPS